MNSFLGDTKSLLKFASCSLSHPTSHRSPTMLIGLNGKHVFLPQVYPYPGKSVTTGSMGRGNVLCLGSPHMGCKQSVFLVSWDSLLFMHISIYANIHTYVFIDITHIIECNNSSFIFSAIWYSITWTCHNLSILILRNIGFFYFLAIINRSVINSLYISTWKQILHLTSIAFPFLIRSLSFWMSCCISLKG